MKKTNYYLIAISFSCLILFFVSCGKDKKITVDDKPVILDDKAPIVSLTSTSNYVTQAGAIKIVADATDSAGVTKVEFYSDNNLIGTDMEAPFELTREYSSTAYGDEYYTAFAYDAAGNKSQVSNKITIRVNVERTVPTLEISLPKLTFKANDNSISPRAILKGAPYQSGTLSFGVKLGDDCSGISSYVNNITFSDGVITKSFQFNNGVTGTRAMSARVSIAGKPNIFSNCLVYTVIN